MVIDLDIHLNEIYLILLFIKYTNLWMKHFDVYEYLLMMSQSLISCFNQRHKIYFYRPN